MEREKFSNNDREESISRMEKEREEYYKSLEKEVEDRNKGRPHWKKITGIGKQTPESRLQLEAILTNSLVDKINSFDKTLDLDWGHISSDLKELVELYQSREKLDNRHSFAIPLSYKVRESADDKLIQRVWHSPEVKNALLEKMKQFFAQKKEITHRQINDLELYMGIYGKDIPSDLTDTISKSDLYVVDWLFENKNFYLKSDFKEWFKDHLSQILETDHVSEILKGYRVAQARAKKDKEDPFFFSVEERNNFLLNAVAKYDGAIYYNYDMYENSGLLDDERTYRLFMQNAEYNNSIAATYNDVIIDKKNKHEAAKIMFQPEEWRKANPAVLNWVTHEKVWHDYVPPKRSQEFAQAAFDRYQEVFSQITDTKELIEPNKFLRKSDRFTGEKMTESLQNYIRLSELTGRPEDKERLVQECERIFDLVKDALDLPTLHKALSIELPGSHEPFEKAINLLNQALLTGNLSRSPEQKNIIKEINLAKGFLNNFRSHSNKKAIIQYYFTLRSNMTHEQAADQTKDFIDKYNKIDARLLIQPWLDNNGNLMLADNRIFRFVEQAYQKFNNQAFDLTKQYINEYNNKQGNISEENTIEFLERMSQEELPFNFELQPQYELNREAGRENEWIEKIKDMWQKMAGAQELTPEQRASPDHLAMVKIVYPPSTYSHYEENEKLPDYNKHLEKYKFDGKGYIMRMTGALGYERLVPEKPGLLEKYRHRMDAIRQIASKPEDVFKKIDEYLNRAEIAPLTKARNPMEHGANLLQLIMDHENRKQKKMPTVFSDQELADLAIAYHLRGQVQEFYRGTEDQLSEQGSQQTKDYIQWNALSGLYVEDGKQTLTTLYEHLKKDDNGQEILTNLAEQYQPATILSENKLKDKLQPVADDLTKILEKAPDKTRHRDIVVKRLDNSIVSFCQGILKNLSKEERAKAESDIKKFVNERLVPTSGNYLENLSDFQYIQELRNVINKFSFNPLQSVEKLLTPDVNTIQQEVGSYQVKMETDITKKGKVIKKQAVERNIIGFFSKTAEVSNARAAARICIAVDTEMWKNPDYFEFALFNQETKECEGTVMLLNIQEGNKKYLLYCPNPSEHLISQVSFENCYKKITAVVTNFAQENNYDGLIVSEKVEGRCTNRTGGFANTIEKAKLRDRSGELIKLNFKNSYTLSGNYKYGGEKDPLHFIWKK